MPVKHLIMWTILNCFEFCWIRTFVLYIVDYFLICTWIKSLESDGTPPIHYILMYLMVLSKGVSYLRFYFVLHNAYAWYYLFSMVQLVYFTIVHPLTFLPHNTSIYIGGPFVIIIIIIIIIINIKMMWYFSKIFFKCYEIKIIC